MRRPTPAVLVLAALGLLAPATLLLQVALQDEDSLRETRDVPVVEGIAVSSQPFDNGTADLWTFEVSRVVDAHGRVAPAANRTIEVLVRGYMPGADEFRDPPRRLVIAVHAAEQHDPDTGIGYWQGWSLEDARSGHLWTSQERHLAAAPWLAFASLASAGLVAWLLARRPASREPRERYREPVLAALAGLCLAAVSVALVGHDGSPYTSTGEEDYGAAWWMYAVAAAGAGLAFAAPPGLALGAAGLALPWVSLALHSQGGLDDPTWMLAWPFMLAFAALGLAAAWNRWASLALAVPLLALAAAACLAGGRFARPPFLGALALYGPFLLAGLLLLAAFLRARRRPSIGS